MTNSIKVLHVTYSLKVSGIETLVTNLHKYVNNTRVEFDFAVYCDPSIEEHYDREVLNNGGHIHKLGKKNTNKSVGNIISERVNLFKLLKKEKYDIIHIHGSLGMHLIEAAIAKLNQIPHIIIHSHSSKINESSNYYLMKKILHYSCKWMWPSIATEYIACSKEAGDWLFPKSITNSDRVKILKNGIDTKSYVYSEEKRNNIRKEMGLDNKLVVGHIGRFSKIKNHAFLVDVFLEIYKLNPSAVLLLIGQGELEDNIKQKVSSLGLENVVHFLGVRKDIPDLLQAMDVIVFPSLFEGLPIVGIESQASGLPVLAADTITKEMQITDNVKYMSLQQSPIEWANEVLQQSNNFERKNTSFIIKEKGFDIQVAAQQLQSFYEEIIGVKNETI